MIKNEIEIEWDIGDTVYVFYKDDLRRAKIREVVVTFAKGYRTPNFKYELEVFSALKGREDRIDTNYTTNNPKTLYTTKKDAIFAWLDRHDVNPVETLQDYFQTKKEKG
jgi:hypothetical protein